MEPNAIVQPDLAPEAMQAVLESNMYEYYAGYGRTPYGDLYLGTSFLRVFTGMPYAMFNGIFGARLVPEAADHAIEGVIQYMAEKKAPCCWYVTPMVRPDGLGELLLQHGFALSGFSPGMSIQLDSLAEPPSFPGRLEIRQVEDEKKINTWTEVVWAAMGFPQDGQQRFTAMEVSLGIDPLARRVRYLAFLNGKPVATSLVLLHAGVAGIYAVSTLPEARQQGIGGAVTMAPLYGARDLGYRVGTLQSSRMGFPVYCRLGFQQVFQVQEYEWKPEQS